jgi:hypothetical protein
MKSIAIIATVLALVSFNGPDKLFGKWQTALSPKGVRMTVIFKSDNTFEAFQNKKPFTSAKYTLDDKDVIRFTDNGCNGAEGVYKTIFFSNQDSVRFELISDSCVQRAEGMKRFVVGRVK